MIGCYRSRVTAPLSNAELGREELAEALRATRCRTLALVEDLDDEQLLGERLDIVNPLLWEIGHVAWFQERWLRRHQRGEKSLLDHADRLYDSMAVPHDTRWDLELVGRQGILDYMERTLDDTLEHLPEQLSDELRDLHLLTLFHEDMHIEAFCYTRQTLGYAPPPAEAFAPDLDGSPPGSDELGVRATGDVELTGGVFLLGAEPGQGFVFDNEQWAHDVTVEPFAMARTAVSQREFADFVDDGGYRRSELWSEAGRDWLRRSDVVEPEHWIREGNAWHRRVYDRVVILDPDLPMVHVNWFEADAYCRWAGRRLPTEPEWEFAAAIGTDGAVKSTYPWGHEPSGSGRANLDGAFAGAALADDPSSPAIGGTVSVHALDGGDTPTGLRQMFGNVWEWTASAFRPYPGFEPGVYEDYSRPWFGDHMVLRGGCWATRFSMMRNTLRNFYQPHRRDVWAGFRTCA
ncbi:MAG: SUMF1/EgtB/PvdO family nonheme iron enzyme [Thermoanaerobaculia bacterium]|nr:SUMF1/EgtB/PvdO family nonheme iron enzyme [Thermoanaerobaculia bacterium]